MSPRRVTYANVASTLAVVLALGTGASYAATQLPKDSVGAEQIRAKAVRSEEVKDGSLAVGDLSAAARKALRPPASVPSGTTVRGGWLMTGDIPDNSTGVDLGVSLPVPAPVPIGPGDVLTDGYQEGNNLCTGTLAEPTAPAGKVCVYTLANATMNNVTAASPIYMPSNRFAFGIDIYPSFSYANVGAGGTFAYTAP